MAKRRSKIQADIEGLSAQNLQEFEQSLSRIIRLYDKRNGKQKLLNALTKINNNLSSNLTDEQRKLLNEKTRELKVSSRLRDVEYDRKNITKSIKSDLISGLKSAFTFFNTVDASIKSSALNLGLSRNISDQYRENLLQASRYAARLGMSIESLTKAQQAYNNEVGTSVLLSAKSLESITAITQGTALTADETGTLVGQFKLLGKNASGVKNFVEDTSVEATNMGVNLNKVLRNISTNFRQIQSFNFANGINGIQKMAMFADMYRINISSAFASIDKARTLEGAVEMSAKLMVMGGEFTKQNMFELGFMARNRPEEFMKKMSEMTRGVYFFNKQTGEFETSAFDLDRLRAVSEATNIPFQELTETARRLSEINLAKSQLGAIDPKDKDLIANMAEITKDGKFTVTLGRDVIDIRNLGANQIALLKEQEKSLEMRAKDALTFDQEFSTLIAEFKTLFLPILKSLNNLLRTVQSGLGETGRLFVGGIGLAVASLTPLILKLVELGSVKKIGLASIVAGKGVPEMSPMGKMGKTGTAMGGLGKAAGGALAVGGAFLAASYGIKMIAESFKELSPDQLNAITKAIVTMGISIPASLIAISLAGAATAKVAPLIALVFGSIGLAALGMGKGIELATTGLSKLFSSLTPEITKNLGSIAIGLTGIGLSLNLFALPTAIAGMVTLTGLLASLSLFKGTLNNLSQLSTSMATGTDGFREFGNAMTKVGEVVNNGKNIKELRQLINDLNNVKISNPINELKEILSKPLKVEFTEKDVSMVINLTAQIDGKQIASSTYSHLVKLGINKANNTG